VLATELFGLEVRVLSPVYHLPCPLYALVRLCLLACLVCLPNFTRVRLLWTVAACFFMVQM
jgi:hypothetical protein